MDQNRFGLYLAGSVRKDSGVLGFLNGLSSHGWWLDCQAPTVQELNMLASTLDLDDQFLDDIQNEYSCEGIEHYEKHTWVVTTTLEGMLYIALTRGGGVLTVHANGNLFEPVIGKIQEQERDSRGWIVYAILNYTVNSMSPIMTQIAIESSQINDDLYVKNEDETELLARIGDLRHKAVQAASLITYKPPLAKYFARVCGEEEAVQGLYDIAARISTKLQELREAEHMLVRSHTNFFGIMRVRLVHANAAMDTLVSRFTLIAVSLIPLHLVSAAFAMNCEVPGENATTAHWFWGIVAVTGAICIGFLILSWRYFDNIIKTPLKYN